MKQIIIIILSVLISISTFGQKGNDNGGRTNPNGGGKTNDNYVNSGVTYVNIVYNGDEWGCNLPITISIGNRTFNPQGTAVTIQNIPAGRQKFVINGNINCPNNGSCSAYGEGYINVYPNSTFYVVWQVVGTGACSISLTN